MGLDYSQKRLISAPLGRKNDKRTKRLRLYAFLTGLMSTIISLVHLIVTVVK